MTISPPASNSTMCFHCLYPVYNFVLEFSQCTKQNNGSICGLFVIAFATTLCNGDDPVKKIYSQKEMRSHFLKCLESECMVPFPSTKNKKFALLLKSMNYRLYYPWYFVQNKFISCNFKLLKGFNQYPSQPVWQWDNQFPSTSTSFETGSDPLTNSSRFLCTSLKAVKWAS